MTIVVVTSTTVTDVETTVKDAETRVETEMIADDITVPEMPQTKNPRNQNTIRIIRKKTDMMEMMTALIAAAIPLNTLTTIPLNNPPQERR